MQNNRDVALHNIDVTDSLIGDLSGPTGDNSDPRVLNPGELWVFKGDYTVTQEDIDSNGNGDGFIENTATVHCNELSDESSSYDVPIIRIPSVVVTPVTGGPTLPVVNLSANPTSGYAPLSVQFTDLSQNAVSRNWDFTNDGTPDSSEPNPIYTYNIVGTYTVNLTANNPNGTASMTTQITVLEATSTGSGGSGGSSHSSGSSRSSHSSGSKSLVISKNGTTSNGTTSDGTGAVTQSGDNNLKQDNMTPASIVEPASKENETSTPAKQSKKTPGFVTIFGITGLLIAYLYRRK